MRLVWNATWDVVTCSVLPTRTDVLTFRTKTERTTMRWGNGTPSTTSVCTSIHGPVVRTSWCECVADDMVMCVWGVGMWRRSGGPRVTSFGGVTCGSWIDLRMNRV